MDEGERRDTTGANDPFELLEQLVGELPARQEDAARLAAAQAAENVRVAAREHANCAAALHAADRSLEAARAAEQDALAAGDVGALDHARRDVLFWGQQRGLRVGPEHNARIALDEALAAGGFADEKTAEAVALPAGERERLRQIIAAYQREYAAVLAACEALGDAGE
jgi:hypothetical protein